MIGQPIDYNDGRIIKFQTSLIILRYIATRYG